MAKFNLIKLRYYFLLLFGLTAILIWLAVFTQSPSQLLEVNFFDVGQGSAIFIEAPNKNQVLIDGGPDSSILNKLGQAMPFYDREIDVLILTHPDSDHLNGLIDVLRRYRVNLIIENGIADSSAAYGIWHNLIKEKNIPVEVASVGKSVILADGLRLDILSPLHSLANADLKNTNTSSIVGRLVYGDTSFLLTGDADQAVEWQMINNRFNLNSDVLGVGHHGSKTSTSEQFLQAVTPQFAAIQVGKNNKFGHPHQEILQRLKDILILRTDIDKDIKFTSDGKNISYY